MGQILLHMFQGLFKNVIFRLFLYQKKVILDFFYMDWPFKYSVPYLF